MTSEFDPVGSLLAIPKFGSGLALHRMAALAREVLTSPWGRRLDALHVTGSNGKGSIASLAALTLRLLGFRTGLFVSPHHFRFNERISVDGVPIGEADLRRLARRMLDRRRHYEQGHPGDLVGAFEVYTTLALEYFAEQGCTALVLEAGLGGRYDPTRLVPGPTVALASVDLEHTRILGPTLEHIAFDKADLCPEGGELVAGRLDAELRHRLDAYLALRRVNTLHLTDFLDIQSVSFGPAGMRASLIIGGEGFAELEFSLPGLHQVHNAGVTWLMLRQWLARNAPGIGTEALAAAFRQAVATVHWPGRLERIADDPPFFIDVAHTPAAVSAAVAGVRALVGAQPVVLVAGVSYDKEAEAIFDVLARLPAVAICTRAHHKGRDADEVAAMLRARRPELELRVHPDIGTAVSAALELARARGMAVFAAGGLFVAIESYACFLGQDPRGLRFL
jgi:dihydrofolate synthase/folylpolyglutamate synthase